MQNKDKTSTITATSLQREVGTILRRVGGQGEHLIVERDGFPVAVILPVGDYRNLTETTKDEGAEKRRS